MCVRSEIADADRELDELIELVRRKHASRHGRFVKLIIQVELGDDVDLEGDGTVGDTISSFLLESLDFFLRFLAVDVVELADLVEFVLLNELISLRILLFADESELICHVPQEAHVEAELLILNIAVFYKHGFVGRVHMRGLEEAGVRLADLVDVD